jgi:hypothetical protein
MAGASKSLENACAKACRSLYASYSRSRPSGSGGGFSMGSAAEAVLTPELVLLTPKVVTARCRSGVTACWLVGDLRSDLSAPGRAASRGSALCVGATSYCRSCRPSGCLKSKPAAGARRKALDACLPSIQAGLWELRPPRGHAPADDVASYPRLQLQLSGLRRNAGKSIDVVCLVRVARSCKTAGNRCPVASCSWTVRTLLLTLHNHAHSQSHLGRA